MNADQWSAVFFFMQAAINFSFFMALREQGKDMAILKSHTHKGSGQ